MINKNYLIFAAAIALASCSVDEYMGENPEFTQTTKENIIGFGGNTGSMSRATSNTGTTEQMLDKQFLVYGWKTVSGTPKKVFDNYWVWYEGTNKTPSNPDATEGADKGWEYVGDQGDDMTFNVPNTDTPDELEKNQYIKYWDYSASNYKFVAGSPITSFNFEPSSGQVEIITTEVKDLAGHIKPNPTGEANQPDPVYIAEPVIIKNDNTTTQKYGGAVNLQFTRLQTKVRVGIYETIPGYKITNIVFYKQGSTTVDTEDANKNNVTLTSETNDYFQGGSDVNATVTYNWDATPKPTYTVEYQDGTSATIVKGKNWYGGQFATGVPAITSNPIGGTNDIEDLYGTDNDMFNESGYFIVLPTPTETPASALTLKCDYVLESLDTYKERINVKGATAAIPAAYCKWEPNKMYTYIFKISQETNGTTGTGSSDPAGLYPITFDAAATATDEGVETIVQTPSITTYQDGSVTANGIEYKINKPLVVTVTDNSTGTDLTLNQTNNESGCLIVYNCGNSSLVTEADLQASGIKDSYTKITGEGNISVSGTQATFTPRNAGYYAIQYCSDGTKTPIVYKYKVIEVKSSGN